MFLSNAITDISHLHINMFFRFSYTAAACNNKIDMCFKICSASWDQGRARCKHARLARAFLSLSCAMALSFIYMLEKQSAWKWKTTDKHTTYTSLGELRFKGREEEGENGHIGHTHAFHGMGMNISRVRFLRGWAGNFETVTTDAGPTDSILAWK